MQMQVNNAMLRSGFREVQKYWHPSDNTDIDKSCKMAKLPKQIYAHVTIEKSTMDECKLRISHFYLFR